MFLAFVHLTARVHAALHQPQHTAQRAFPSQGFHQGSSTIAHHLGQLDQAALRVLPGKEHDEPVLEHHADQLGIHFTQRPPGIGRAPFVHPPMLFPELVQQFHLPAFAQQHQGGLKGQALGWRIGDQDRPLR